MKTTAVWCDHPVALNDTLKSFGKRLSLMTSCPLLLPCDMDCVPALNYGGCSDRNEFFFYAKCLKIV